MASASGGPHVTGQSSHSSTDTVDPITKFKIHVPLLKESLQKVMINAAAVFHQNAQFDSCIKGGGTVVQRFDKSLEEFYAICDQIELNLNLAIEILNINAHCQRHVPTVQPGGSTAAPGPMKFGATSAAPVADLQSYTQYQAIVRTQLACAKEVHDALLDCAKKIQAADRTSQLAQPSSS